jgi:hypothetical protein
LANAARAIKEGNNEEGQTAAEQHMLSEQIISKTLRLTSYLPLHPSKIALSLKAAPLRSPKGTEGQSP